MKVEFEDRDVVFKLNGTVEMDAQQGLGKTLYRLNIKAITEVKQDIAYAANSKLSSASLVIWHRRCGHVNYRTLLDMASGQAVEGMVITNRYVPPVCEGCVLGKLKRNESPTSNREPVAEVGRLIAADVGGPMQEPSLSGARYYVLFKDKCSGYRKVYFIKTKAEAAGKFRLFIPFFQNETGKIIKTLLTDGGGEFKGGDWTWVEELGIRRLYTVTYSPQQNGSVERTIGQ
jgi:hypothetical protein